MEEGVLTDLPRENRKLKTELTAQKAVCQKLREEKEASNRALNDAKLEIKRLQEELDLREQRFRSMKNDKENEILSLKQNIRDLELQLSELTDVDIYNMENSEVEAKDTEHSVKAPEIPDIPASQIVDALMQWEGMNNTVDLFKDLLISESNYSHWTPGSSNAIRWKHSLNLYISCSPDSLDVLDEIMKNCIPTLQELCKESGCNISPICINANELTSQEIKLEVVQSLSNWLIQQCDIFVGIIKNEMNVLTKLEAETGFLNNPSSKHALFVFLSSADEVGKQVNHKVLKFKDRIRKCNSSEAHIIECGYNLKSAVEELREQLVAKLNKSFSILQHREGTRTNSLQTLALIEDMKVECEQRCLYEQIVKDSPLLEEKSVVFDWLDEYIIEESPVKGVSVIFGSSGSGKSTLIANWIKKIADSGDVLVLYHFVKIIGSSSAEACCVYRRFIQQLQHLTKDDWEIPKRAKDLSTFFVKILKRISTSTSKKVLLVLDNLDQIKNFEEYFNWMLKPLPSGLRVIVTASEEDIPETWKLLQSIAIPSFTYTDATDLVEATQKMLKMDLLTSDQIPGLGLNSSYSPLWCSIATRHVLYSFDKDMEDDDIDTMLDSYGNFEGFPDLLHHVFEFLHSSFPNMFSDLCMIIQLLYWSRNGLSLTEIQHGVRTSDTTILLLLCELLKRNIIRKTEDLYYIHNVQVQEAIENLLCTDQSIDYMLTWTSVLVDVFSDSMGLISRQTEELLWLFKRAELKKELYYAILNMDILKQMYASFRIGELSEYWLFLHPNENTMASQYFKQVKINESEDAEDRPASYFVTMCGTVGKILMELGYQDEAVPSLQYALELCESYSDPESLEIAELLIDLGKCTYLAASYSTSEGYLTEALHIYENVYTEDSVALLRILEVLENAMLKLGKKELSEIISTRIFSIKQATTTKDVKACKLLVNRYHELEELRSTTEGIQEKCTFCNESAVIIAIFGQYESAEMRMMEAIQLLEGIDDPKLSSVHINLGNLYFNYERLEMATVLFEKSYEMLSQSFFTNKQQWITVTEKLVVLYRTQGRIESAEPIQRHILSYLKEEYGPDHFRVAKALNNLAVLYCLERRFEKAIPVFEEAIKLYKYNLGEKHETVIRAINNMKLATENENLF